MPKMKDLGINVIPETMKPAECLPYTACGCSRITNPCLGFTINQCTLHTTITVCFTGSVCPAHSIVCLGGTQYCPGGSICTGGTEPTIITITPTTPQFQVSGGLTRESVAQLKEQLHAQIAQLDEVARNLGPKTSEEIDAREKQLKAELDDLASRRKELKK